MLFHPRTDPGVAEAVRSLVASGIRRRRHAFRVPQQLMLLAAIVFIPLLVLHAMYAAGERHHLLVEAGYRARALVNMAAQQQDDAVRDGRELVRQLARMPQIVGADPASCQNFLEILTSTNPQLNALAVLTGDGRVACTSPGPPMDGNLASQPWVRAALLEGAGTVQADDVAVEPRSGRLMIGLAQQIVRTDPAAPGAPRIVGALVARVDLGSVWQNVSRAASAASVDLMLLDDGRGETGTAPRGPLVIASSEPAWLGRRFPEPEPFAAAARSGEVLRVTGIDGTEQVIGVATMARARQQFLIADISTDELLANMRSRTLLTLVGVSVVGALVLWIAWVMARWSFLRPLAALVAAAKRLRAGDLKVRVNSRELWAPEFSELAVALNIAAMRLERNHRTLSDRANRDGLTGLASRRRFDEQLAIEWRRARRAQTPLSVLMIDVDEFKKYNDRYGHVMGDECLRQIAAALLRCLRRPSDMAARYGGEEIVILLPDTDLAGAAFMGSRFLAAVHELGIVHRSRPDGLMSVSIGVASVIPAEDEDPMPALVQAADEALYAAKREGRARVVLAGAARAVGVT